MNITIYYIYGIRLPIHVIQTARRGQEVTYYHSIYRYYYNVLYIITYSYYYYCVAQQATASEVLGNLYNAAKLDRPVTDIILYGRAATSKG